jgi:hypothetical protein
MRLSLRLTSLKPARLNLCLAPLKTSALLTLETARLLALEPASLLVLRTHLRRTHLGCGKSATTVTSTAAREVRAAATLAVAMATAHRHRVAATISAAMPTATGAATLRSSRGWGSTAAPFAVTLAITATAVGTCVGRGRDRQRGDAGGEKYPGQHEKSPFERDNGLLAAPFQRSNGWNLHTSALV